MSRKISQLSLLCQHFYLICLVAAPPSPRLSFLVKLLFPFLHKSVWHHPNPCSIGWEKVSCHLGSYRGHIRTKCFINSHTHNTLLNYKVCEPEVTSPLYLFHLNHSVHFVFFPLQRISICRICILPWCVPPPRGIILLISMQTLLLKSSTQKRINTSPREEGSYPWVLGLGD